PFTRNDVPQALEAIVLRCLAKEPADRFPDVRALADALAPFGPHETVARVERIRRLQPSSTPDEPLESGLVSRQAPRQETLPARPAIDPRADTVRDDRTDAPTRGFKRAGVAAVLVAACAGAIFGAAHLAPSNGRATVAAPMKAVSRK